MSEIFHGGEKTRQEEMGEIHKLGPKTDGAKVGGNPDTNDKKLETSDLKKGVEKPTITPEQRKEQQTILDTYIKKNPEAEAANNSPDTAAVARAEVLRTFP